MRVEILTQVVFDLTRDADQYSALKEKKYAAKDTRCPTPLAPTKVSSDQETSLQFASMAWPTISGM